LYPILLTLMDIYCRVYLLFLHTLYNSIGNSEIVANDMAMSKDEIEEILSKSLGKEFSEINDSVKHSLYGICLTGRGCAKKGNSCASPFPELSIENRSFVAGFNSIECTIGIPSAEELLWVDTCIIEKAFRKITLNDITVTRHMNKAIIFIGSQFDIEKIDVLCQEAYSKKLKIYRYLPPSGCKVRCLTVMLELKTDTTI